MDNPNQSPETKVKKKKKLLAPKLPSIKDKGAMLRAIGLILLVILLIIAAAVVIIDRSGKGGAAPLNADSLFEVNSDSVLDLVPFPSGVVVLTSNTVEYVDTFGNVMNSNDHSFSNPVAVTAGKNLILYDLGGNSLRLEKNSAKGRQLDLPAPVSCADITVRGTYAYVLNADAGYQSHLFIYSDKGKLLFEWESADYVIAVALSPNGKYAAVSLLSVDNAQTVCKVVFFSFSKDEPLFTASYEGETVYDMEFVSSNKIAVFTEKGAYLVNNSGEQQTLGEYSANELNHSDIFKSGMGASALGLYGNNSNALVRFYTKGFGGIFEHTFNESVNAVNASESYVAVVLGNEIRMYSAADHETGKVILKDACIDSVISGKRLFVLTSSGLYNYNLNKTYEE